MAYLGKNPPLTPTQSQYAETFSGTGAQTAFTLSKKPISIYSIMVSVSGVKQQVGVDYTVNGYVLNFTSGAPATGTNNIEVHFLTIQERTFVPADGSVTLAKFDPSIPLGATGGGSNKVFFENDTTVSVNYTITAGKNAMSAGPITINGGVDVTVPDGSEWSVV